MASSESNNFVFVLNYSEPPEGLRKVFNEVGWFTHVSSLKNFDSIKSSGLLCNEQQEYECPNTIRDYLGRNPPIVCLTPRSPPYPISPSQNGPYFRLAVSSSDLTMNIGLDWSFTGCIDRAKKLFLERPDCDPESVLLEILCESKSLISYEPISRDNLKVCADRNTFESPITWPSLSEIEKDKIYVFGDDASVDHDDPLSGLFE